MADSPEQRTINYAEQILHVHDVHTDATTALDELKVAQAAVVEYADQRRRIGERLTDREMELASAERAKHYEQSQAWFERHMKEVLQADPAMRALRVESLDAQAQHDLAEQGVRECEFRIRICTARMEELGGLLQFYGTAKLARATLATTPPPK